MQSRVRFKGDFFWMELHWNCILCLEVGIRSLHVLSTAQADAESSVTA